MGFKIEGCRVEGSQTIGNGARLSTETKRLRHIPHVSCLGLEFKVIVLGCSTRREVLPRKFFEANTSSLHAPEGSSWDLGFRLKCVWRREPLGTYIACEVHACSLRRAAGRREQEHGPSTT